MSSKTKSIRLSGETKSGISSQDRCLRISPVLVQFILTQKVLISLNDKNETKSNIFQQNLNSHCIPLRHMPFQRFFLVSKVTRFAAPYPPAAIEGLSDPTISMATTC